MWLRLSNGRTELIANEDHVKRLLAEGAVEIADPRLEQSEEESEQAKEPEPEQVKEPLSVHPDEDVLLAEQQESAREETRKPKRGKSLA